MERALKISALSCLTVLLSSLPAPAQQPTDNAKPATATAPAPTKQVNLLATVRDKKGQPVATLNKQDFVLEQDGRAQTITQLTPQGDAPIIFGMLADTGPGQRRALADERKAGSDFVKRTLREGKDKAFVLHFDKEVELLQDITTSHEKLAKGIDQISVGEAPRTGETSGRRRDQEDRDHPQFFFGGSMLYDAIFLSADELLKNQPGRKAVVLFSDGQDRESKTSLEHAIEAAQRADMLVYCVYVQSEHLQDERSRDMRRGGGGQYPGGSGPFPGGGGPFPGGNRRPIPEEAPKEDKGAGKKVLQRIAKETGARYFELSKKQSPEQIYAQIEDELRHQYSLSFTPDKPENGFHKLHLSTRNGDYTVQAPESFYIE